VFDGLSGLHRTLQGMEQPGTIAQWVDGIEQVGWETTNQMLRDHGLVPSPTVHILVEDMTPAYAAYITSREFYPGRTRLLLSLSWGCCRRC